MEERRGERESKGKMTKKMRIVEKRQGTSLYLTTLKHSVRSTPVSFTAIAATKLYPAKMEMQALFCRESTIRKLFLIDSRMIMRLNESGIKSWAKISIMLDNS